MKPRFYNSPRIQKWSLFAGLVLALGFNLSWNPQLATLARNEMHQIDLAQSKPPEGAVNKEDPNLMDKVFNLAEYAQDDRLGEYVVLLTPGLNRKDISYMIQKKGMKNGVEGYYAEGCKECRRKSIAIPAQFQANNMRDIKALIVDIAQENQTELLNAAKKNTETTKKDEDKKEEAGKGKGQYAEKCRNLKKSEIMDCQIDEFKAAQADCDEDDKACNKKIKALFKPIDTLLKTCSRYKTAIKEDVDCDDAKDLAKYILEEVHSDYVLAETARILKVAGLDNNARKREILIQNGESPQNIAKTLQTDFDRYAGTYGYQKYQYDAQGKIVVVDRVSDLPSQNSFGGEILSALLTNERFTNKAAAVNFFKSNFYDDMVQTRTALLKNPMGFAYPDIDLENTSGLVRPDLASIRVNNYRGANAVPAAPQIAPAPAYATPAGPTAQPATPTTGFQPVQQQQEPYLSPAQRGKVNRTGTIQ